MKNCSNEAKSFISLLNPSLSDQGQDKKEQDIKNLMFKLKNYLAIDHFAEEFISYEGIKYILDIINTASGNTLSYAMNAFISLLGFMNGLEYTKENKEVIAKLYEILYHDEKINVINFTLSLFTIIIGFLQDEGVEYFISSAQEYAKNTNTKIYSKLVECIDDPNADIKKNALLIITSLISFSFDKAKQSQLLVQFKDAGLLDYLEKNIKDYSPEFQVQLNIFQQTTKLIIKGSFYEIEVYRNQLNAIEEHCKIIEKKAEYALLNQKLYENVIDDLITYKKLQEFCIVSGGFYDPSIV